MNIFLFKIGLLLLLTVANLIICFACSTFVFFLLLEVLTKTQATIIGILTCFAVEAYLLFNHKIWRIIYHVK